MNNEIEIGKIKGAVHKNGQEKLEIGEFDILDDNEGGDGPPPPGGNGEGDGDGEPPKDNDKKPKKGKKKDSDSQDQNEDQDGEGGDDGENGKGKDKKENDKSKDPKKGSGDGDDKDKDSKDGLTEKDLDERLKDIRDRIEKTAKERLKQSQTRNNKEISEPVKPLTDEQKSKLANKVEQDVKKSLGGDTSGQDTPEAGTNNGENKSTHTSNVVIRQTNLKPQPKFQWDKMLQKLLASASDDTEESYTKMSNSAIRSSVLLKQTGSAAVKPGEVKTDNVPKLLIVLDVSYSMSDIVPKVYAELDKLSTKTKSINKDLYICTFSNDFILVRYDIKTKKGYVVNDNTWKDLKGDTSKPLTKAQVFAINESGGTDFSNLLVNLIEAKFLKPRDNVIMFSDADCTAGYNFTNTMSLLKKYPSSCYFCLDNYTSFERYVNQNYKSVPKNLTYVLKMESKEG